MGMKSFKSRGYVTEKFSWNHYYWYLTNEGIEYLRDYLHLPEEIVPETLKKPRAPPRPLPGTGYDQRGPRRGGRYGDDKKFGGAPGDFNPSFREGYERRDRPERGGFGRGGDRGFGGRGGYKGKALDEVPLESKFCLLQNINLIL